MAKQVKFTVDIMVNGQSQLTTIAVDAKEVGKALGKVQKEAKGVWGAISDISNITVIAGNVKTAFQSINSEVKQLTDAYQLQLESETKLETVMRQRMNATAADIQSMKDLASAQQQVGIIGDEVSLMGMQQLATFINHKQALEQLTPAMLNLLAQQKGFNATAQDAVGIANLFGKAMQGNASALTRVGITMSDAQKEALKTGDEMSRAALLADIITQNVGNMNEKLAQTDAGKAKQIANAFGDWQEQIGAVIMPFQTLITQIDSVGTAANTFVMLSSGVTAAIKSLWAFTTAGRSAVLVTNLTNASVKALNAAARALGISATVGTGGVKVLTFAIRGLMAATGIGAAIMVVVAAVDALGIASTETSKSTDDLADAQNNISQEYASVKAQIQTDIATLKDFKGTQAEEKEMVEKLNNTYGATLGYFSSVSIRN